MKRAQLVVVLALMLTAAVLGGCARGMKATFFNQTSKPVDTEFLTQGGLRRLGEIPPGKKTSDRVAFDVELLPAEFNITIHGGTAEMLTRMVRIPKKHPRKLRVEIRSDRDLGHVIEVFDEKGRRLETR